MRMVEYPQENKTSTGKWLPFESTVYRQKTFLLTNSLVKTSIDLPIKIC